MNQKKVENFILDLLKELGEDPHREGLLNTPKRVAKAFEFLTTGYKVNIKKLLNDAIFNEKYDEMVLVKNIDFYSLCEHHMLPFLGRAHVAYIPAGKVIGLSKIPRIVDMFARRLQVQERMTRQVANFIDVLLKPKGVAVVMEALHLCSMMRGVRKHDARMTTSTMLGAFKTDQTTRMEFLDNISRSAEPLHF